MAILGTIRAWELQPHFPDVPSAGGIDIYSHFFEEEGEALGIKCQLMEAYLSRDITPPSRMHSAKTTNNREQEFSTEKVDAAGQVGVQTRVEARR